MTSNLVIKRKISPIQIKRNYLKHRMFFSPVFIEFLKSIWIFENFEKKKKDERYFQYSWLKKTRLLKCLKGPFWEQNSSVNVLRGTKHSWNLDESIVNTLTADGKYSCQYREIFARPTQTKLRKKQKHFSPNFNAFLEST